MSEGWVCPLCGTAWAPWVAMCNCTRNVAATTTYVRPPLCDHANTEERTVGLCCRTCGHVVRPGPPATKGGTYTVVGGQSQPTDSGCTHNATGTTLGPVRDGSTDQSAP